jgi:hypothetical protein
MEATNQWATVAQFVAAAATAAVALFAFLLNKGAEGHRQRKDRNRAKAGFMRISLELDMLQSFFRDTQENPRTVDQVKGDLRYVPVLSAEVWGHDLPFVLPELAAHRAQLLAMQYKRLLMLEALRRQWLAADEPTAARISAEFGKQLGTYQASKGRESLEQELRSKAFGFEWRNIGIAGSADPFSG